MISDSSKAISIIKPSIDPIELNGALPQAAARPPITRELFEALLAAERIRRTIENLDIPHPGNPPHGRVTMSVGVASVGPVDLAADDIEWIARADAALYRAKAAGRGPVGKRAAGDEIGGHDLDVRQL